MSVYLAYFSEIADLLDKSRGRGGRAGQHRGLQGPADAKGPAPPPSRLALGGNEGGPSVTLSKKVEFC